MLNSNGFDIQRTISYAKKEGDFIVFLDSGGVEVCRIKDDSSDKSLPYSLAADGLTLSLKDAGGDTLSTASVTPPLHHVQMVGCKPEEGAWTQNSNLTRTIVDGGLYMTRSVVSGVADAIEFVISPMYSQKWQFPKGSDYFYAIKVTLLTANNNSSGDGVGDNTVHRAAPPTTVYQFSMYRHKTNTNYKTLIVRLNDIPEAYLNAFGVVFIIEVDGAPLIPV